MVDVKSRKCRTEGCDKWPLYGVAGTKTVEYCAQHAPDGMVDVKSRKCRTEGCGKRPSHGVAGSKPAEYCAQHARLKCGVEGYKEREVDPHRSGKETKEREVDPHRSGKETIGNILPNSAKHQTAHPPATTSPQSEGGQGFHKRVRHPEFTSTASMRPIPRESAGGAGIMQDRDGQKYPVKRDYSVKAEVLRSL